MSEIEEVKRLLDLEQLKNKELHSKLDKLMTAHVTKKLMQLQDEKKKLAIEVEQEEEFLINNLQKKLSKLQKEKVDLEVQLEHEEEYIVNQLQKQLLEAKRSKDVLEHQLNLERERIVLTISEIISKIDSKGDGDLSKSLQEQISKLTKQQVNLTKETAEYREKNNHLREELYKLTTETFVLEQKLKREVHKRECLNKELIESEHCKEMIQELHFNHGDRRKSQGLSQSLSPRVFAQFGELHLDEQEITPSKRTPPKKSE